MKGMREIRLLAAILGLCTILRADPPALIRVIRNISPNAAAVQPYVNAKAAAQVLGLRSVSGLQETWLIEEHDSFASVEEIDRALSLVQPYRQEGEPFSGYDDVLTASRMLIGLFRPGLSYRSEEAVKGLPKARYLVVTIYRIRPGTDADHGDVEDLLHVGGDGRRDGLGDDGEAASGL